MYTLTNYPFVVVEKTFYHQGSFLKTIPLFFNIALLIQKSSLFCFFFRNLYPPKMGLGLCMLINKEKILSCFTFSMLCMHIPFSVFILTSLNLQHKEKMKCLYVATKIKKERKIFAPINFFFLLLSCLIFEV